MCDSCNSVAIPSGDASPLRLRVIACEIAFREICHLAARSRSLLDLEFLSQGHHDVPERGRAELQSRINAVPAGRYDAVLVGYGLCSRILPGLRARTQRLVIPRAHDCITFFLGSKERYERCFNERPGTYYYTSGWWECARRRGLSDAATGGLLPTRGGDSAQAAYEQWVARYGPEKAKYLLETLRDWAAHYTHGTLIDFEFTRSLGLRPMVEQICAQRGWQFEELPGDLGLLRRWLDGQWDAGDFLVVPPSHQVIATHDARIIAAEPVAACRAGDDPAASPVGPTPSV